MWHKGGTNAGGRHNIQQPKEGGQETNTSIMGEGYVDFRGTLEVGGSEDGPEDDSCDGPTRAPGGNKIFPGSTSVGQETEGE